MLNQPLETMKQEFNRQMENLLSKGYPEAAGLSEKEFFQYINPLQEKLSLIEISETDTSSPQGGFVPFVIVITNALIPSDTMMKLVEREGKNGIVNLTPVTPPDFNPTVSLPNEKAYLLIDINRGMETINVAPKEALTTIQDQDRSPLTIDEGIALITHFPEFLQKNNCYSLLASRDNGKHIPAIWISEKQPKLGWCWEGNPHTWLGSASCKTRIS